MKRALAFLAKMLPQKQLLSKYPLFLTNTVPVSYFSFQKNLIFKESPTLPKETFPICINGSFLSSQYVKVKHFFSQQTFFLMIHFLSNPPLTLKKQPCFTKSLSLPTKNHPSNLRPFWKYIDSPKRALAFLDFCVFYWYLRGSKAFLLIPPKPWYAGVRVLSWK